MKLWTLIIAMTLAVGMQAACQESPMERPQGSAVIDGMSPNVNGTNGGSVRDSMAPPPAPTRPDLVNER